MVFVTPTSGGFKTSCRRDYHRHLHTIRGKRRKSKALDDVDQPFVSFEPTT
jgi:hypothetical protein